MTSPIVVLGDLDAPPLGDAEDVRTYTTDGCVTCYKPQSELNTPLKRCAKCGTKYCSVECQKKDWRTHKQLCKLIEQLELHKSLLDGIEVNETITGKRSSLMALSLKQQMFYMTPPNNFHLFVDTAIKQMPTDLVGAYRKVFENEFLPSSTLKKPLQRSDVGREESQPPGQAPIKYWSYERVDCMYKFQLLLDRKIKEIGATMDMDYTMGNT